MILEDFAKRVRRWLKDLSQERFTLEEIYLGLDDFIREHFFEIVKQVPRYYLESDEYSIADAEDEDNELYALPDDFYAVGNLRRGDLTDKPRLRYIGDHLDIQKFAQSSSYPFYDPDPLVPLNSGATWTLHDAENFRIVPAPMTDSYTYEMKYYRKWEMAVQAADDIDVPDLALSFCAAGVATDILLAGAEPPGPALLARLGQIMQAFHQANEKPSAGTLPEVEQWW